MLCLRCSHVPVRATSLKPSVASVMFHTETQPTLSSLQHSNHTQTHNLQCQNCGPVPAPRPHPPGHQQSPQTPASQKRLPKHPRKSLPPPFLESSRQLTHLLQPPHNPHRRIRPPPPPAPALRALRDNPRLRRSLQLLGARPLPLALARPADLGILAGLRHPLLGIHPPALCALAPNLAPPPGGGGQERRVLCAARCIRGGLRVRGEQPLSCGSHAAGKRCGCAVFGVCGGERGNVS